MTTKTKKNIPLSKDIVRLGKEATLDLSQGTFMDKEDFKMIVLKFIEDIPDDAWVEVKPAPFTAYWSRLVKEVGIPVDPEVEEE